MCTKAQIKQKPTKKIKLSKQKATNAKTSNREEIDWFDLSFCTRKIFS